MHKSKIHDTSAMDRQLEPNRRLTPLRIALAIGLVLVTVAVLRPTLSRWNSADRSVERARLRIAPVTRGELNYEVAVQGRVVAASRPTLFAPSAGLVVLHVREGESVQPGQKLAEIESPELASRLQQERATLLALRSDASRLALALRQQNQTDDQQIELLQVRQEAASRGLERAERLHDEGLLNVLDLEAARDELTIQTLELAQARRNRSLQGEMREFELSDARARAERQQLVVAEVERQYEELTLRAPFEGLVATVEAEDRDAVIAGQPLIGVVDLSDLEVEINIPEAYADEVQPGLDAWVQLGGASIGARVTRVAPEVRNGQVEGRLAFADGTPAGLRQNQRLSTRIVLDHRADALMVPRGPWLESQAGRRVWVVDGELAQSREVQIGVTSVTEVEILSGLEVGEQIVLSDLSRFDPDHTLLLRD